MLRAEHGPPVRDRSGVHDAVAGAELGRRKSGELDEQAPLDEVQHDVAGMLVPDIEVVDGRDHVFVDLEVAIWVGEQHTTHGGAGPVARRHPLAVAGPG